MRLTGGQWGVARPAFLVPVAYYAPQLAEHNTLTQEQVRRSDAILEDVTHDRAVSAFRPSGKHHDRGR
jgi:hypothetical protein